MKVRKKKIYILRVQLNCSPMKWNEFVSFTQNVSRDTFRHFTSVTYKINDIMLIKNLILHC